MMKKEIFVLLDRSSDKLPTVAAESDAGTVATDASDASDASDEIPVSTVLPRRRKCQEVLEEVKDQMTDGVQKEERQYEQVEAPTPQPPQGRG
eukprot:13953567-Ditylum_brightwellii.AAC.1